MRAITLTARSPADTQAIARLLAPVLRAGDAILLTGELAAGKTFFVQALVAALGSADAVTSPTFGIAHFYQTEAGPFLHVDAYRLTSVEEYRDLGLEDYLPDAITAVEWGGIVARDFPEALTISIAASPEGETVRTLTISSPAARWTQTLPELETRVLGQLA
jgi:tRNA threonylcarbamoyladenosine biosynthesis protein TsaE